eukprot:1928489-Rhodomonas_salina.2
MWCVRGTARGIVWGRGWGLQQVVHGEKERCEKRVEGGDVVSLRHEACAGTGFVDVGWSDAVMTAERIHTAARCCLAVSALAASGAYFQAVD